MPRFSKAFDLSRTKIAVDPSRKGRKGVTNVDIEETAEEVKARIHQRAKELEAHRPPKKFEVGDLVNVSQNGDKYEGLKIDSIEWVDGNFMLPSRWEYYVKMPNGNIASSWKSDFQPFDSTKDTPGAITNPYPVFDPERTIFPIALRAWHHQSFRSESRAQGYMKGNEDYLISLRENFEKLAEKHGTQNLVSGEFNRFLAKFREYSRDYLHRESGMMSTMIAGPANFPVRQMEKRENAIRNQRKKAEEWEKKAIQSIEKTLRNEPDKLGNPDDLLTVQRKKLAEMEMQRDRMKLINTAYRKFKSKPQSLDANTELSEKEKTAVRTFVPQYSYEKSPFLQWQFQNLGANILRVKKRIEELEAKSEVAAQDETPTIKFDGGEAYYNATDNRIQVHFDDKPDADTRTELKKNGFKWAPSVKLWQRAITDNALRATAGLSFISYQGEYRDIFKTEKPKPVEKIERVTDAAEIQQIKNAIAEAEMILKSGRKNSGEKYSEGALEAIRRDVIRGKARIGMEPDPDKSKRIRIAAARAKALSLLFIFEN